jgi:hypothetical protein
MSFTYDLSTTIGQIRIATGDTVEGVGARPDRRNLSDEEITYLYQKEGSDVNRAIAAVFETLEAEWTREYNITAGPRKDEANSVAIRYRSMSTRFRKLFGGGDTAFSVGLNRNDGYELEGFYEY